MLITTMLMNVRFLIHVSVELYSSTSKHYKMKPALINFGLKASKEFQFFRLLALLVII